MRACLWDNKSPKVSETFLTILADLNNGLDGLSLSSDFQLFQNLYQAFKIVLSTLITNGIIVTFMFHSCCFFSGKA